MIKILLLFCVMCFSMFASTTILIDDKQAYEKFEIQYLKDDTSKLTINDIVKENFDKKTKNNFNLGYFKGSIWFKVNLENNKDNNKIILSLNETFYEIANLYYYDDEKYIKKSNSLFTQVKNREVKSNHLAFKLNLTPNERKTYYIELKGKYAYFGKVDLNKESYFHFKNSIGINVLYSFVLGIVFYLIIFTSFLYLKTKEKIYFYYFSYCFFNFIYFLNISGLLVYFDLQKYIYNLQLAPAFMIAFLILFSREYLETEKYLKRFDSILKFSTILFFILGILVVYSYQPWNKLINNFSGIMGILLIIVSIIIYFKGNSKTKYYIYAIVLFFVFIFMFAFMVNGTLEYTNFTRYGVTIANSVEMIVFSLILANRYHEMKENINQYLKIQVDNRTNKLNDMVIERELLLKEVYHRVKNNFHMITGMLYLEEKKQDKDYTGLINRVKSMSLIHEYLYKLDDLSEIRAKEYFEKLIFNLKHSYSKIEILPHIENIIISIDEAISLGVIINEIITNSIKHNKEKDNLYIEINLSKSRNNISLSIQDNGKGLKTNDKKGLGLKLVNQFSQKLLNQKSNFSFENGAKFELTFNIKE